MPSLPAAGPNDVWGGQLNEFLLTAHNTDGTLGTAGGHSLASGTSVGATTLSLKQTAAPRTARQVVAIDPYTIECELRTVTAISGTSLTVAALTYAHATGDQVLFIDGDSVTPALWGAKGDASTDDHTALQMAARQALSMGIWLEGKNHTYIISQPLLLGGGHELRHMVIKAHGSYAPAETNNAMVMNYQGGAHSFTATAADDIFTTPTAHGLPADNIGVVFQGTSLPTGITAGKFYYCRDRTATTFKVATTSGGAAVNLTADGSGSVFTEVYSLQKSYMDDVYVNGNSIAGVNGILMYLQQQGYWNKVRVDNCPGYGVTLTGQQHVLYNFESISCGTALILDNMGFLYCFGFNAEICNKAIVIGPGGSGECGFWGVHLEQNNNASAIGIEIVSGGARNLTLDNMVVSMNTNGAIVLKANTGSAQGSGYRLRNVRVNASASDRPTMIADTDRGITLDSWDDFKLSLAEWSCTQDTTSGSYVDTYMHTYPRPGAGYITFGSQNINAPSYASRPGSTQVGEQARYNDSSGNRVSGFNKAGVFFTERNTAPADADLVAGELAFWFDDTNGAAKVMFKAKEAGGTVRTGNVALV